MKKIALMKKLSKPVKMAYGGDQDLPDLYDRGVPDVTAPAAPSGGLNLTPGDNTHYPPSKVTFGQRAGQVGEALAPFASNIYNATQRPPAVPLPTYNQSVTLDKPSFNNERYDVSRQINDTNAFIGRNVDGNTAAKVALANQGEKLTRLSAINEREKNMGVDISNRQSVINQQIQAGNNEKTDQYNAENVERNIAQQRNQSANVANAGDKFVGIQNEQRKAQVDLAKTKTMAHIFASSGVGDRLRRSMMAAGEDDILGKDYRDLKRTSFSSGGILSGTNRFNRALMPRATTSYRSLLTAKPQ